MKRFKLFIFVLALVANVPSAWADASGSCGDDLNWTYVESTHTLTITGTGEMNNYAWYPTAPWNSYKSSITSVSLPNGLKSIGNYAFYQCTGLTSITIPSSVISIGLNAFSGCSGLTSISYAEGSLLKSFGEYAFESCTSLTSLTVPANVTTIGRGAFNSCNLTSVTLQDCEVSIGEDAFRYCSSLSSISFGSNVTSIERYAFSKCDALTSITVPNSVHSIGPGVFSSCAGLTSISIGSGVTSIGGQVITYCPALASVTIDENNTFYDSRNNCNAIIETESGILLGGCKNTIIPSGVTSIADYAFCGCSSLETITIPSGVTSMGSMAFMYCSGLTSITFPSSLNSIEFMSFQSCDALRDMYVNWLDLSIVVDIDAPAFIGLTTSNVNLHLPFEAWGSYNVSPWSSFKQVPVVTAKGDPEHAGVYYSTFYHGSKKYALPAGVEAYTAQLNGAELNLTKIAEEGDVLPARKAVILKSSVVNYELVPSDASPVTAGENDLLGVDAATSAPANCYVLSGQSTDHSVSGVGFYQFSGTLAAHKVYLTIPSGSPAPKRISFAYGTTTDLENQEPIATTRKMLVDGILYIERGGHTYNAQGQFIR